MTSSFAPATQAVALSRPRLRCCRSYTGQTPRGGGPCKRVSSAFGMTETWNLEHGAWNPEPIHLLARDLDVQSKRSGEHRRNLHAVFGHPVQMEPDRFPDIRQRCLERFSGGHTPGQIRYERGPISLRVLQNDRYRRHCFLSCACRMMLPSVFG